MKPTRVSPALAWLLSLSLLLAAVWGQWHRVAHDTAPHVSAAVPVDAGAPALPDAAGHAAGDLLCQVLDHLAHSDGMAAASVAPWAATLLLATPAWRASQPGQARKMRLWQARAPPRFA